LARQLVAAGLGICLIPEVAAQAVPTGVVTVKVSDPAWLGRSTVALTRPGSGVLVRAVVDAVRHAARTIGS
jgi:DNA-binding transcriptional LysR family regulator